MITRFTVEGMTCDHCVHAVTEEVSGVPGVTDVSVTLEGGAMVVTSDQSVDLADIKDAVSEAGDYTVVAA